MCDAAPALGAARATAAHALTALQCGQRGLWWQARGPGSPFTACHSDYRLSADLQGSLVRDAFLLGSPAQLRDYTNCRGCCLTTSMMKIFSPISGGNSSCCRSLPCVLSPCPSVRPPASLGSLELSDAGLGGYPEQGLCKPRAVAGAHIQPLMGCGNPYPVLGRRGLVPRCLGASIGSRAGASSLRMQGCPQRDSTGRRPRPWRTQHPPSLPGHPHGEGTELCKRMGSPGVGWGANARAGRVNPHTSLGTFSTHHRDAAISLPCGIPRRFPGMVPALRPPRPRRR